MTEKDVEQVKKIMACGRKMAEIIIGENPIVVFGSLYLTKQLFEDAFTRINQPQITKGEITAIEKYIDLINKDARKKNLEEITNAAEATRDK